jgi:hypothetical protein
MSLNYFNIKFEKMSFPQDFMEMSTLNSPRFNSWLGIQIRYKEWRGVLMIMLGAK